MRFKPLSEDEIQNVNLLEPGKYTFEVLTATEKFSKAGNEMIQLQLRIWDNQNKQHYLYDYLLESISYKLKHFADSCGLLEKYKEGNLLADDCVGKSGKVEIIIQKSSDPNYGDRNTVKDYVVANKVDTTPKIDIEFNDDIPF